MAFKRKKDDGGDKKKEKKSKISLDPIVYRSDVTKSKLYEPNIVRSFYKFKTGQRGLECLRWSADNCVTSRLRDFKVFAMDPYKFYRRITAVKWHPTKPNWVALGSKCGEVIFRNINDVTSEQKPLQSARHQAITNFCFDPFADDSLLMSSVDGTISHWNYDADVMREILDLNDGYITWFCCVNASEETGLVVAGDSPGMLTLLSKDLRPIAKHKVHKAKVNTAEFCKKKGNILATASLDKSVKLWDIRMIGKEKSKSGIAVHLECIEHDHPINAAYFSKTNNNRLLLTDQKMELKVYTMPFLTHESTIYHPHRQFQHLTPIKASWHPLADLIVIGRYPDPSWPDYELEQRSIDIIDPKTGQCDLHMLSNQCKSIMSLNEFNVTGDYLASGMGLYVAYWKARPPSAVDKKTRPSDGGGRRPPDSDSDDDDNDDEPKLTKPAYPQTKKKPQTKKEPKSSSKCPKKGSKKS
uniref:DNA damage-binding protein 2 n=1 Tax=Lygus hesperus TaxID=30085 RepID=A0A146KTI3_LYGHE